MPISLQVQIIRQAISPRLAISIFLNFRVPGVMINQRANTNVHGSTSLRRRLGRWTMDVVTATFLFQKEAGRIRLAAHSQHKFLLLRRWFQPESHSLASSL